jgi:hypothetical protein
MLSAGLEALGVVLEEHRAALQDSGAPRHRLAPTPFELSAWFVSWTAR